MSTRFDDDASQYSQSLHELQSVSPEYDAIPDPPRNEDAEYVEGFALFAVCAGITLASFLLFLDSTIVATAVPRITTQFHSLGDIGWYGSAYQLAMCAIQLPFGKIYQLCRSKTTFLSALVLFELGSLICGVAQSSIMLIVGRAIAGLGAGGISNGGLTIIGAAAPLAKRPILFGILIGVSSIGIILGPIIGGALTEYASWRWCFYINLPIGAVTFIVLLFIRIPDAKAQKAKGLTVLQRLLQLDFSGGIMFAGAIIMILLALEQGGTSWSWNSAKIIGLFVGGGVLLLGPFVAWEIYRKDRAMFPMHLLSRRVVSCAAIANIFANGAFFSLTFYLPTWFQVVKDASPTMSGVYTLPGVLSQIVGTILTGFLVSKTGYYTPFSIVGSVLVAVSAGLMTTFSPSTKAGEWIGFQIMAGIGRGAILQQPITAVQAHLPQDQAPLGTALIAFCQNFGAAIFLSLGQTVFGNRLTHTLQEDAPSVDAALVKIAGATGFRHVVAPDQVAGVLKAYNSAITTVFYLTMGAACACFLASFGLGWKNLAAKDDKIKEDSDSEKEV